MAKYTFHISFDDGSNYTEFFPTTPLSIKGERAEDFFIIRDSISEIKINRSKNTTVYDTLASWFIDSIKFDTDILIDIKKSSVVKWSFVFGIKMGKPDFELKTYTVTPEINDDYTDIYSAIENELRPGS